MTPHAPLLDMLFAGQTMADAARVLGISKERVRQIALKYGHTAKTLKPYRKPSRSEVRGAEIEARRAKRELGRSIRVSAIVELRRQGLQQVEIAARLGISQSKVSEILIANDMRSKRGS